MGNGVFSEEIKNISANTGHVNFININDYLIST